jgi:hypothetical protein
MVTVVLVALISMVGAMFIASLSSRRAPYCRECGEKLASDCDRCTLCMISARASDEG